MNWSWKSVKEFLSSIGYGRGREAEPPLSKADFQDEIANRIRAAIPAVQLSVLEDFRILMRVAEREEQTLYLGNAFHAYLAESPCDRRGVMDRYVRSYIAIDSGEDAKLDSLVPMVKSKEWLSGMHHALAEAKDGNPPELFHEQLNEELFIVYAFNSSQSIRYVAREEIEIFGLQEEGLRSLAVRNMRGFIPGITVERGPLVSMVVAGGDFEASLILFPELWEREKDRMRGEPVFAVPARDLLLFADSANTQALEELKLLAKSMWAESTYPLTFSLFVVKEGRFELSTP